MNLCAGFGVSLQQAAWRLNLVSLDLGSGMVQLGSWRLGKGV